MLTYLKGEIMELKEILAKIISEVQWSNKGINNWNKVSSELGKRYGIVKTPEGCRKFYNRYIREDFNQSKPTIKELEMNKFEYRKDGTMLSERKILMSETEMKDPTFVLKAHGFNPDEFELVSAQNNFWTTHSSEDGERINYQSKITVKPKTESNELTKEDVVCLVRNFEPKPCTITLYTPKVNEPTALSVAFADIHIGSLSWRGEVGEDNDYKIAFAKMYAQMEEILDIIKKNNVEQLYLCFLGDFLHIDTVDSTTSRGTRVDTDTRPKKIVAKALEILMATIEKLSIIPTKLIWIEGNHSRLVEYAVFQALPFIYRDWNNVEFDVRPISRKWFFYKGNLVGLHHGEMKKDTMFNWLQVEARELWGKANYVEQHSGHMHQELVTQEKGGIIQRTNPTSKVQDLYEFENGWKSNKVTIAYLWSENDNLKAQFYLRGK